MEENRLSEIIKASLDGIRDFTDISTVVGNEIITPSGVTVIPVSRINVGFINGGADFSTKKSQVNQNFGCGGGTGVSITPLAFLVIDKLGCVNLIPLEQQSSSIDKIFSLIDKAPDIFSKFQQGKGS